MSCQTYEPRTLKSLRFRWREFQGLGNFFVPPFMDKPRAVRVQGTDTYLERVPAILEELCSSWNQLRLLECDLPASLD